MKTQALSHPETIKSNSTFRAKALLRQKRRPALFFQVVKEPINICVLLTTLTILAKLVQDIIKASLLHGIISTVKVEKARGIMGSMPKNCVAYSAS